MIERENETIGSGGLLCDEMGLGKTFSTIGLFLNKKVENTLILGPLAVLDQWAAAIKKTSIALFVVEKGVWKHVHGFARHGCVYIANYEKLIFIPSQFKAISWDRLVCDEAHMIRNYKSEKFIALKKLKFKHKWFLTGTPIVNRVQDLGALMRLLIRANPLAATTQKGIEWMGQYALQRTTEQLRESLTLCPEPIVHSHHLDFKTEEEASFYRGIQGKLAEALQQLMEQDRMDMIMFLALLTRLRQLSTHPQVYISSRRKQLGKAYTREDWVGDSTKTEAIVNILNEDAEPHGFVIFCHFNEEIQILKERLQEEGAVVYEYNGSMTPAQRTAVIEQTKKVTDKNVVLLAQIQTAGTGLNLQHLDRVIFTSPWWTAALMDQAVGRVVRLGQEKQVHVHYLALVEEETINIDSYINERVETKRDLCTQLLAAANHEL
jgi:SNF2 family DNA or RNA helicase